MFVACHTIPKQSKKHNIIDWIQSKTTRTKKTKLNDNGNRKQNKKNFDKNSNIKWNKFEHENGMCHW